MAREFGSSGCGPGSVPVYDGPADVVFQSNLLGCISFGAFSGMENMMVFEKDDAYLDINSIPEDMKFGVLLSGFLRGLEYGSDEYNEASQTGVEWQALLRRYNAGDAGLSDLRDFDGSGLEGWGRWNEIYTGTINEESVLDENADIREILRRNGYSEEAIEDIFDADVNNPKFKGNNVLSNALCQIGYSNCSDWGVTAVNPTGDACMNADGEGTYQNGECVTDTSENSLCYNIENGVKVEGKRDANGQCISLGSGGDASDTNCVVITQENADECGYEITSDGQLVPKDLSGDPNSYPTYVNCGGGIFAETEEDCPDLEGTGGYSEEERNTAQAIKDWIEGQIGRVQDMTVDDVLEVIFGGDAWDPQCKDEGDLTNCTGTDGTQGNKCWKDCVNISVLGGIPGLPMPPGAVDIGTVRDLENTAKEIGTTIGSILNPDENDEGFIEKVKNWVIGKIEDIFGDLDDVTLEDITGWITGTLGNVLGALILIETENVTNTVKEKIDDILLGVAPTGDDENCIETEYFEANKEKCTALGYLDCDASVGEQGQELTGGIIGPNKTTQDCSEVVDPNVDENGCLEGTWDGTKCVCPPGSDRADLEEDIDGKCSDVDTNTGDVDDDDDDVDDDVDDDDGVDDGVVVDDGIDCESPVPVQPYSTLIERQTAWNNKCVSQGYCPASPGETPTLAVDHQGGDCSQSLIDDDGDDGTVAVEGCQSTVPGSSEDANGNCICPEGYEPTRDGKNCKPKQTVEGPDDKCNGNPQTDDEKQQCLDQGWTTCPDNTNNAGTWISPQQSVEKHCGGEVTQPPPDDDPPTSEPPKDRDCWNNAVDFPACQTCPSGQALDDEGMCVQTYTCDDPNATVQQGGLTPGACGPCKEGYVFDGAVERCVQEEVPDPCDNPAYAAANPTECGTPPPECNDCTCAEYAAANPEECGPTPPPPEPPEGGGGGGGGMFRPQAVAPMGMGDPQLLARTEFPIVDYLSESLAKQTKDDLMSGMLTGNIV